MSGVLLRIAPWLALAVALIGGGWWVRDLLADRDVLAAQVTGLEASTAAWAEALAEEQADRARVESALGEAHDRIADAAVLAAELREQARHASIPPVDCPVPDGVRDGMRRMHDLIRGGVPSRSDLPSDP